jgi:predicted ATPase/DNA-binding XRE family transcriptional regulator
MGGWEAHEGLEGWLRAWRHTNRWSQERLAEALGYDVSYVAKIEQGRRAPSRQFVARLAEVLEVPREELLRLQRRPSARIRLPVPDAPIVGRSEEVAEVTRKVRGSSRCLTLVGAPGIGKTSLALEVAWNLGQSLRHGACFVPLAEVPDAGSVLGAIVRRLELFEEPGRDLEHVLTEGLRHREMLLVLDNFEHVVGARSLVGQLARNAPQLRILVTSRQALDVPEETVYPVSALAFPAPGSSDPLRVQEFPAVQLFIDKSRRARADFSVTDANLSDVAEICARLDGLPLAITLTASASRILSPAGIAKGLAVRLELPTEADSDPLAHHCLRSALDWSWDLLPPTEQLVLASTGAFAGSFSLDALEWVCGDRVDDVLSSIDALERKSLIQSLPCESGASSRFACLDTVRRYALERLAELSLQDQARARHFSYFLGLAEREGSLLGGREQAQSLRRLDEDFANLQAAFVWAMEENPEGGLQLAAKLWRFFSLRHVSEGRRWLTRALQRDAARSVVLAEALNGLTVLARMQGNLDLAEHSVERARDVALAFGATAEVALAVLNRGIIDETRGAYDDANVRFEEALAAYKSIGDARGVGHATNCLGVIALRRDQRLVASMRFLEALGRFRSLDDQWSVAVTATNLGWIAETDGDLPEARDWYEETWQIWDSVGDEHGQGRALASLGRVERRSGDVERARELLQQALRTFFRLGDRRLAAACLVELAEISTQRNRLAVAARLLGATDALHESMGTSLWPDEAQLVSQIVTRLATRMGEATYTKARSVGRTLSLEDAINMVESDRWPPVAGRRGAIKTRSFLPVPKEEGKLVTLAEARRRGG